MRRILSALLLPISLMSVPALADDSNNYGITPKEDDVFVEDVELDDSAGPSWEQAGQAEAGTAGTVDDSTMVSTARNEAVKSTYLDQTAFAFQPQAGLLAYTDALGDQTSRAAYGLTFDVNVVSAANRDAGALFIGPASGFIFSHLGSPGSGLFGAGDTNTPLSGDANMFFIPADLKVGYAIAPTLRISVRAGGNVTYRSVANSVDFGPSSESLGSTSGWRIFPNVGGDVEFALGPNASLLIRPDWTFTTGNDYFTGTIGLGVHIG